MPEPGQTLDFVSFCQRAHAKRAGSVTTMGQAAAEQHVAEETAALLAAHGRDNGTLGLLEFRRVMKALADKYGWDGTSVTALRRFNDLARAGSIHAEQLQALLAQLHVRQGRDASPVGLRGAAVAGSSGSSMLLGGSSMLLGGTSLGPARPSRPASGPITLGSLLQAGPEGTAGSASESSQAQGGAGLSASSIHVRRPAPRDLVKSKHAGTAPAPPVPSKGDWAAESSGATSQPPGVDGKRSRENDADTKYMDNLLRNAEVSTAQRDALEGLPHDEKKLLMRCFQRHDENVQYVLDKRGCKSFGLGPTRLLQLPAAPHARYCAFLTLVLIGHLNIAVVGFWRSVISQPQWIMHQTAQGARKVTIACLLLNEVAAINRSTAEIGELFARGDADGSGWVDLNEAVAALIDAVDDNYSAMAHEFAVGAEHASITRRDYRNVEGLPPAYPVAVRVMRELDLDHGGALGDEEFVRGMRLVYAPVGLQRKSSHLP